MKFTFHHEVHHRPLGVDFGVLQMIVTNVQDLYGEVYRGLKINLPLF